MSYESLQDLFLGITISDSGTHKAYYDETDKIVRTVGYVRLNRVSLLSANEISFFAGDEYCRARIVGDSLLKRIEDGELTVHHAWRDCIVRFSIAGPWDGNGNFNPARCYLMCSDII